MKQGKKRFEKLTRGVPGSMVEEMNFGDIRVILLAVGCAFAVTGPAFAKAKSVESEVQQLANFPALQQLAAKSDAADLRRFLARVASAYRKAGYETVAAALPETRVIVELFGAPKKADQTGRLKKARAALRHIRSAIVANGNVKPTGAVGSRIPDYSGIIASFQQIAEQALKNLSAGKNVANFLRKPSKLQSVLILYPEQPSPDSNSSSYGSSGTYLVDGYTVTVSGTLNANTGWNNFPGITINNVPRSLQILRSEGYRWITLPSGVPIPTEWASAPFFLLTSDCTDGSTVLPSGTHLVKIPSDTPLPEGASEVSTPLTLNVVGTPTPTPTPTPDPAA